MAARQHRSMAEFAPVNTTVVIKWDEDGKYSTLKAGKISGGVSKIGEKVTIDTQGPNSRLITGTIMFSGSAKEAEDEIRRLIGELNDDGDAEAGTETDEEGDGETRPTHSTRGNARVDAAPKLVSKAKRKVVRSSAAENHASMNANQAASSKRKLVSPGSEDSTEMYAYPARFGSSDNFAPLPSVAKRSKKEERLVSASISPPMVAARRPLYEPCSYPTPQHDCCVIIMNKLDQFERSVMSRILEVEKTALAKIAELADLLRNAPRADSDTVLKSKSNGEQASTSGSDQMVEQAASYSFASKSEQLLTRQEIKNILNQSCSASNFATHLVRRLYTKEDRVNKNCSGTRGKSPLSPRRLGYIRDLVESNFEPELGVTPKQMWKKCVTIIDSQLRRDTNTADSADGPSGVPITGAFSYSDCI